jgi:hypothetical protein
MGGGSGFWLGPRGRGGSSTGGFGGRSGGTGCFGPWLCLFMRSKQQDLCRKPTKSVHAVFRVARRASA